ncbi:MAG: amidase [Gemmatimonadota bacterium]|nr:amidase [Gemmatimonadota bacterium]
MGLVTGEGSMRKGSAMDRLRANLAAAQIPVTEEDLERIEADGYLERVVETVETLRHAEAAGEPDFLGSWEPDDRAASGSGLAGSSQESRGESDGIPSTLTGVAELVRRRVVSPVELTKRALDRIDARDRELNLFQTLLTDSAMEAARRAEEEIGRGDYRGPLHGVPVAIKDLLEMRGTPTTAGSEVRTGHASTVDAAAVERFAAAGAVIVGKTRLSEFAYWPGSTNPHFGPTRNPRDPERDAGGSSSGSAAAVATECVYAALGTDTGGSVRIPAALCGVVGHKPTFGRVSLFGCVPLAWSLDHLGPLARSAEDAALVLEALAGPDGRDARTRSGSDFRAEGVGVGTGAPDLAGLRVGVMGTDGSGQDLGSADAVSAWRASNRALEDMGARLVEVDLSDMHLLWRVSAQMLAVEAAAYHAEGLRRHYGKYGRFCRGRLVGAFAYGFDDMLRAQTVRRAIRERWRRLWERVDVLSTPCQPDVAPELGVAASTRFTNPFNALGWPTVSVPFGSGANGLPLGTQLAGRPWDDGGVLRAAAALGRASGSPDGRP